MNFKDETSSSNIVKVKQSSSINFEKKNSLSPFCFWITKLQADAELWWSNLSHWIEFYFFLKKASLYIPNILFFLCFVLFCFFHHFHRVPAQISFLHENYELIRYPSVWVSSRETQSPHSFLCIFNVSSAEVEYGVFS